MRRIVRAEKYFYLLRPKSSAYIYLPHTCSICKFQAAFLSYTARQTAEAGLPMTEKIRRKIWGTDQPPGQPDPYGKDSYFERAKRSAKAIEAPEQNEPKTTPPVYSENYQPSNTWDGLDHVGEDIEVQDPDWLPGNIFKHSFVPKEVVVDGDKITAALHRALVEVFSLQQAGKSLSKISQVKPGRDLTMEVQIVNSKTGVALQYPDDTPRKAIIRGLTQAEPEENTSIETANQASLEASATLKIENETANSASLEASTTSKIENETAKSENSTESEEIAETNSSTHSPKSEKENSLNVKANENQTSYFSIATPTVKYEELFSSWDSSWLNIPITDLEIKFAIMKRILQLTGIRIPDAIITSSKTVGALLAQIIKPPKPAKLVEALAQKKELLELPNVTIFKSRITVRDKETALGRWKLIEEEFRARGLTKNVRPPKDI